MDQELSRLRDLARRVEEISSLPIQEARREHWRNLNDLRMSKPMVYARDYSWEMVAPGGELASTVEDGFLRMLEFQMRATIFTWEHFQADMVVDPVVAVPVQVRNLAPIRFEVETVSASAAGAASRRNTADRYLRRIFGSDDIEKIIPMPRIEFDEAGLDRSCERASDVLDGILRVERRGIWSVDFNPWDDLMRLFGIEEGMMDLYLDPDLMHEAMGRYVEVHLELLRQYESAGLLHGNNGNALVGSGALGYTSDLPTGTGMGAKAAECWGFCIDQIFTSVSPELHEEFATRHEIPWMERFGLTYYGCCERLDHKIDLLRKFKNLRKISISPFSDKERSMEQIGDDYVVSLKPNSTLLAADTWDMEASRREIVEACNLAEKYGCNIEIIMKTMISLNGQPRRLEQWCNMASEIAAGA